MLKIKDNVDLEELKKFGLERFKDHNTDVLRSDCNSSDILFINTNTRYIYCEDTSNFNICESGSLECLFDIIQAGLVEKVDD